MYYRYIYPLFPLAAAVTHSSHLLSLFCLAAILA